jgi:hypothetical protein
MLYGNKIVNETYCGFTLTSHVSFGSISIQLRSITLLEAVQFDTATGHVASLYIGRIVFVFLEITIGSQY